MEEIQLVDADTWIELESLLAASNETATIIKRKKKEINGRILY